MELVEAGTLKSLIDFRYGSNSLLSEEDCSCIMSQILNGLVHIHQMDIVHHDLKPENILMRSFHHFSNAVRIADFGLGMKDTYSESQKCGTILYMAPEQFSDSVERLYRKV